MVNLVEAGDFQTITDSCQENTDAASSPSPSPVPRPANECFRKDQTLFLIDLMRQHIKTEGLPKTLKDRNARLKYAKANKKQLWKDAAEKLGSHFTQSFCPDKVARKWNTLVDAYKKVNDKNKTTGKGTIRFQLYSEMDDLLGGQHDVVFPVVGTSAGLEVCRPEALGHCSSVTAFADTASSPATTPTATPTPPRKRRRVDDEMMQFPRDSEETSRQRREETVAQLKSAQQGFQALMTKLLDKL
ncbi:hypothetical protein SKAU_G00353730 [Synaphobranchus kaupii]|uniref:Myb/SANT-like DNA-binding domain-containing protein n=1 Tax=Synaphobranchus kaupii TaxID=118154 RepID=A0A9Q1IHH1_SYNKA|nr:hypothetical protein SKAU_G00353730 [Synaphobranchus kaupii]